MFSVILSKMSHYHFIPLCFLNKQLPGMKFTYKIGEKYLLVNLSNQVIWFFYNIYVYSISGNSNRLFKCCFSTWSIIFTSHTRACQCGYHSCRNHYLTNLVTVLISHIKVGAISCDSCRCIKTCWCAVVLSVEPEDPVPASVVTTLVEITIWRIKWLYESAT